MRKTFLKKLTAIMLVAMMAVGMLGVAAAGSITITDNEASEGHTYDAYQIFAGTIVTEDGKDTLKDIVWGSAITDGTAFIAALGEDFEACTNASAVATVLESYSEDELKAFAAVVEAYLKENNVTATAELTPGTATSVTDGYYLIVDNGSDVSGATMSSYIVQVVGSVSMGAKNSVPTVEKKVKDSETGAYEDVEDATIGADIEFQLTGKVASNIADYDVYYYQFKDILSAGLTYTDGSVKVMVGTTEVTSSFDVDCTNNVLTITCDDLTAISGITASSSIVVTYTAVLNEDAAIEGAGNTNTATVIYSNDPSNSDGGTVDDDGDGNPDEDPKSESDDDTVTVLTYDIDVLKINGNSTSTDDNHLAGVTFELVDANNNVVGTATTDSTGAIKFEGIDAGTYTLNETATPEGYEAITGITVTVTGEGVVTWNEGEALSYTVDVTASGSNTAMNNGVIEVTNYKGSSLPSTGGIGTTILYIVGGILVVGAGVTLVVRKRMQNEAE